MLILILNMTIGIFAAKGYLTEEYEKNQKVESVFFVDISVEILISPMANVIVREGLFLGGIVADLPL